MARHYEFLWPTPRPTLCSRLVDRTALFLGLYPYSLVVSLVPYSLLACVYCAWPDNETKYTDALSPTASVRSGQQTW